MALKIYQVMRNSDMTEGRGPMVRDKAFLHKNHAENYIDTKSGVMGRRQKWSTAEYGDWKVDAVDVIDHDIADPEEMYSYKQVQEDRRQAALNKLNDEDKRILGIK